MIVLVSDKEDPRLTVYVGSEFYISVVKNASDAKMAGVIATDYLLKGGLVLIQAKCGPVRAVQIADNILLGELPREVDKNIMILTSPGGQPTGLEDDYTHTEYGPLLNRLLQKLAGAESSSTRL